MNRQQHRRMQIWGIFLAFLFGVASVPPAGAQEILHRAGIEVRPVYVLPTHRFLSGANKHTTPIDRSVSYHLEYAFQNTRRDYAPTAWQGIGMSHHRFLYTALKPPPSPCDPSSSGCYWNGYTTDLSHELGNPTAFYLFQGAQIARIGSRFSLDYEWNFGLSFGWRPYDFVTNDFNKVIGSRVNAYLNANFYLNYFLTSAIDLSAGVSIAHFSNGNTAFPNAGLNTAGLTFGAVCYFNRQELPQASTPRSDVDFQRHIGYEAVLFGARRKKGVKINDKMYASPSTYPVAGINFAAMVNLGHKVRVGVSLDGVYDGSANIYPSEEARQGSFPMDDDFLVPSWEKQWALGIAPQVDYVMPYFTLTFGLGVNVLHGGGDLKSFYQKLALKIDLTRNTFLHIGYNLREFNAPNYLMLGVGMRFND